MLRKLRRNIITALRHPDYLPQYLQYWWQEKARGGARIHMPWGDELRGFVNFSEYRSGPNCLDTSEQQFLAQMAQAIQSHVNDESCSAYIIDVGANIGVTGLYLATLFPNNPVVCFEPAPETYSTLRANIDRNIHRNVACHQAAVSDFTGYIPFDVQPTARANARITNSGNGDLLVPVTSLDTFCSIQSINRIGLLKLDTEGYEHRALAGAEQLLREEAIDVIYYEFCPALERSSGAEVGSSIKMLNAHGYTSFCIDRRGMLRPFKMDMEELPGLCNLVALTPKMQALFSGAIV
jgi:FkbM family methyltransferase